MWVPPSRGELAVLSCARPWLARPPARSWGQPAALSCTPDTLCRTPASDTELAVLSPCNPAAALAPFRAVARDHCPASRVLGWLAS